jgi:hypothetical protein
MSGNPEGPRRWTISEGALVKINLRQCECGRVWVPPMQASKANGVDAGWYQHLSVAREAFESDSDIDPVLRVSSSKRGQIICPDCQATDEEK